MDQFWIFSRSPCCHFTHKYFWTIVHDHFMEFAKNRTLQCTFGFQVANEMLHVLCYHVDIGQCTFCALFGHLLVYILLRAFMDFSLDFLECKCCMSYRDMFMCCCRLAMLWIAILIVWTAFLNGISIMFRVGCYDGCNL